MKRDPFLKKLHTFNHEMNAINTASRHLLFNTTLELKHINVGEERENSYQKKKRSPDERHTQTDGSLTYKF